MQIIAREQQSDGAFVRQHSTFRRWVRADGSGDLPAEHGRYHLYLAKACPWASRTLIVHRLNRLERTISVSFAHPLRDERDLFITLGALDLRLAGRRYLVGDRITEADWRLFVTLVRFDAVYYSLFKCNLRRIVDYARLWGFTRELYRWPGIAETVDLAQIKAHYYGTHPSLNPTRIIPDGPALDFDAPHGRMQ